MSYNPASSARCGSLTSPRFAQANLTGIDNDTRRIDRLRLGATADLDNGTSGTYYFDAFESRRTSYIGLLAGVRAVPVRST